MSTAFVAVTSLGITFMLLAVLYFVIYLICKAISVIEREERDNV